MTMISENIRFYRKTNNMSQDELAEKLNYSYRDMCRILEGKLMLPPAEIRKIAEFFGITKQELLHYKADKFVPELQYMKEFSDTNNLDMVLDLLDEYVDLKEAM